MTAGYGWFAHGIVIVKIDKRSWPTCATSSSFIVISVIGFIIYSHTRRSIVDQELLLQLLLYDAHGFYISIRK